MGGGKMVTYFAYNDNRREREGRTDERAGKQSDR